MATELSRLLPLSARVPATSPGGKGQDILIGGNGADTVRGNDQDDLLIAGFTSYDNGGAIDIVKTDSGETKLDTDF